MWWHQIGTTENHDRFIESRSWSICTFPIKWWHNTIHDADVKFSPATTMTKMCSRKSWKFPRKICAGLSLMKVEAPCWPSQRTRPSGSWTPRPGLWSKLIWWDLQSIMMRKVHLMEEMISTNSNFFLMESIPISRSSAHCCYLVAWLDNSLQMQVPEMPRCLPLQCGLHRSEHSCYRRWGWFCQNVSLWSILI